MQRKGELIQMMEIKKISWDELDEDYQLGGTIYENQPFTGIAYEDAPHRKEYVEQEFRLGLPHGYERTWRNGVLVEDYQNRNGSRHGHYQCFSDNGKLIEEGEFEHGILVSKVGYDDEGKRKTEFVIEEGSPQHGTLLLMRQYGFPKEFQ
jgi:antitoxin component YwqK of YwqJK toxin-antitoxin module